MDLSDLRKYLHKILKITVHNNNDDVSDYPKAVLKITLEGKSDNEIIVFSNDRELTDPIPSSQDGNNYYIYIPNTPGIDSNIYAHFLMKDLYDDIELKNELNFISYDLTKLKDHNNATSKLYQVSDDEHPQITSVLPNSIDGKKNPNYKNYDSAYNNKEHFPISSRYYNRKYTLIAPDINKSTEFTWRTEEANEEDMPYWEIKIPIDEIGDIMTDHVDEDYPINVYFNYEYLPTSTEYHEHFYGIEGNINGQNCHNINVFDGEKMDIVNESFHNSDNYRLINLGNKTDISHSMYVDYSNDININDFSEAVIHNNSCSFDRNQCDDYFIYTPQHTQSSDVGLHLNINLESNTSYVLKYYMWIPSDVKEEIGYIDVEYLDDFKQKTIIGSLEDSFKTQDKTLYNQWIYHEIPFRTVQEKNRLHIVGPKIENNIIFFTKIQISKLAQHTPVIKYANKGVFVVENNQQIKKSNNEYNNECINNIPYIPSYKQIAYNAPKTPHKFFHISLDDNFEIKYYQDSTTLAYNDRSEYTITYEDNYNVSWTYNNGNQEQVDFEYNSTTGVLSYTSEPKKIFTYGVNNSFSLNIIDSDGNAVTRGFVRAGVVNTEIIDKDDIKKDSSLVQYLGQKDINSNGEASFEKINFSNLTEGTTYYLRVDYKHPCYDKCIHEIRKMKLVPEEIEMEIEMVDHIANNNKYIINSNREFPLHIKAIIKEANTNQIIDKGYCELSVDDEVKQSTFVDADGIAHFYLNIHADQLKPEQVIKIVYYEEYEKVTLIKTFDLIINADFNEKDPVPIRFNILNNDKIEQEKDIILINDDDCLLMDIDISDTRYVNYSIRLYKQEGDESQVIQPIDEEKTYINIEKNSNNSVVIGDFLDNKLVNNEKIINYIVTTDSKINDSGAYLNNKYRPYSKSIQVKYIRT